MTREEYERTCGRRGHNGSLRSPISSLQDVQSRKSRRRMKCLISIGLILPALAAVIGVAAWAVSADVVMNSGNRVNKADNQLLQSIPGDSSDDNKDIFRMRIPSVTESDSAEQSSSSNPLTRKETIISNSTTPSPQEPTDVGAILSKLISASGIASGGNGPRFVVVAPLPDNDQVISDGSYLSRADQEISNRFNSQSSPSSHLKQLKDFDHDLIASDTETYHNVQLHNPKRNATHKVGLSTSSSPNPRRSGESSFAINLSPNNHRIGFNPKPLEMSGFEPYVSKHGSPGVIISHKPGPPLNFGPSNSFQSSSKLHPSHGYFNIPSHSSQRHISPLPLSSLHSKQAPHKIHNIGNSDHQSFGTHQQIPGRLNTNIGGFGLKPIQKHLQNQASIHALPNQDSFNLPHGPPPRADESNRWGSIGFTGGSHEAFGSKPQEGISLSISSPSGEYSPHGHSSEPISVIKSIFLPFLPKPKVNLNARVVFGVVLDKGIGLGGQKKEAPHPHLHHPIY